MSDYQPRPIPTATSGPASAPARGAQEPERKQTDEGRAATEIFTVLAIEGAGVALGCLGGRVALFTAGAAVAYAAPAHGLALAPEAKAVAEEPAAKHGDPGYPRVAG
jgi:hypothetical protein